MRFHKLSETGLEITHVMFWEIIWLQSACAMRTLAQINLKVKLMFCRRNLKTGYYLGYVILTDHCSYPHWGKRERGRQRKKETERQKQGGREEGWRWKERYLKMCSWSRKTVLMNSKLQTNLVLRHLYLFSVVKEKAAVLHWYNRIGFLCTRSHLLKMERIWKEKAYPEKTIGGFSCSKQLQRKTFP